MPLLLPAVLHQEVLVHYDPRKDGTHHVVKCDLKFCLTKLTAESEIVVQIWSCPFGC